MKKRRRKYPEIPVDFPIPLALGSVKEINETIKIYDSLRRALAMTGHSKHLWEVATNYFITTCCVTDPDLNAAGNVVGLIFDAVAN